MIRVIFTYYNREGESRQKDITRQTKAGIIKAINKARETMDFHRIERVSHNLVDCEELGA